MFDAISALGGFVGGATLGSLLTMWITHRLALSRDRTVRLESDIRAQKAAVAPVLKSAIKDCSTEDPRWAWNKHKPEVQKLVLAFSTYLRGRQRLAFDRAWEICERTTDQELGTNELAPAQRLIKSRLEALLEIVDAA